MIRTIPLGVFITFPLGLLYCAEETLKESFSILTTCTVTIASIRRTTQTEKTDPN